MLCHARGALDAHARGSDPGMGNGEYDQGWITAPTNWTAPPQKTGKPGDPLTADEIVITAADWPSVEWPMSEKGGSTWTGEGAWGEFHLGANGYCARKGLDPPFGPSQFRGTPELCNESAALHSYGLVPHCR